MRTEKLALPRAVSHGTRSGFNLGCHCTLCRVANADYFRDYRRRKTHHPTELYYRVLGRTAGNVLNYTGDQQKVVVP